jgi:hypothetical protein
MDKPVEAVAVVEDSPKEELEVAVQAEEPPKVAEEVAQQVQEEVQQPPEQPAVQGSSEPAAQEEVSSSEEPQQPPELEQVPEPKQVPEQQQVPLEPQPEESQDHEQPQQQDEVDRDAAGEEPRSQVQGDMNIMFILDLMRQRKEKMIRQKKDDNINEMAMKKKQMILEARQGKRILTRPAHGGFVGVRAILAGSKQTSPSMRRKIRAKTEDEANVDIPPPDNTELLIMGMIRDEKEKKFHEAHHVSHDFLKNKTENPASPYPRALY